MNHLNSDIAFSEYTRQSEYIEIVSYELLGNSQTKIHYMPEGDLLTVQCAEYREELLQQIQANSNFEVLNGYANAPCGSVTADTCALGYYCTETTVPVPSPVPTPCGSPTTVRRRRSLMEINSPTNSHPTDEERNNRKTIIPAALPDIIEIVKTDHKRELLIEYGCAECAAGYLCPNGLDYGPCDPG